MLFQVLRSQLREKEKALEEARTQIEEMKEDLREVKSDLASEREASQRMKVQNDKMTNRLFTLGDCARVGPGRPSLAQKSRRRSCSVVRTVALVARDLHSLGKMSKIRGIKFRLGYFRSISTSVQRSRTVAHTRPTGRADARPVVIISPQTP